MKKVLMIFPNMTGMAEFIIKQRVKNAEVNSFEHTLVAIITDEEINVAKTEYLAFLKVMTPVIVR